MQAHAGDDELLRGVGAGGDPSTELPVACDEALEHGQRPLEPGQRRVRPFRARHDVARVPRFLDDVARHVAKRGVAHQIAIEQPTERLVQRKRRHQDDVPVDERARDPVE